MTLPDITNCSLRGQSQESQPTIHSDLRIADRSLPEYLFIKSDMFSVSVDDPSIGSAVMTSDID